MASNFNKQFVFWVDSIIIPKVSQSSIDGGVPLDEIEVSFDRDTQGSTDGKKIDVVNEVSTETLIDDHKNDTSILSKRSSRFR